MPNDDVRHEIRESFAARCDSYQFDELWNFLSTHPDIRRLPADPASLLAELQERYSDDALVEAGLAELANDGLLRLRAKLNAPGKLIVIIRDRRTDVVVDILTETGSVLEDELPIFTASVGDQLLLMPDDEHHEVLVVFSIQDLAVLRACGIPATLAAGMEGLCPADIDRLCEIFSLDRKQSRRVEESEFSLEDEAEEQSPGTLDPIQRLVRFGATGRGPDAGSFITGEHADEELDSAAAEEDSMGKRQVFVVWSPATLEIGPPVGFDAVTAHLKELKQYMGLDLHEVHVWTASSEDVKRIQFFMRHRDNRCD